MTQQTLNIENMIENFSLKTKKAIIKHYNKILTMSYYQWNLISILNMKILEHIAIKKLRKKWNKTDYQKLQLIQSYLILYKTYQKLEQKLNKTK